MTLLRAVAVCLIAGMLVLDTMQPQLGWLVVGRAGWDLLLDGLDGRLARHYGVTSAFGARLTSGEQRGTVEQRMKRSQVTASP